MYGNRDSSLNSPPPWDPAGNVPFREWLLELQAWLNLSNGRMHASAQESAIQLAMRGIARRFALSIPVAAITYGAAINGVPTGPVTYVLYCLPNRFEALGDARSM